MPQELPTDKSLANAEEPKMADRDETANASHTERVESPWATALNKLREWDPAWAEQAVQIMTNPWTDGCLSTKFVELVSVGLNASQTNLNPAETRRHIRAALAAGAGRQEILFVLKTASIMSIHYGSFNAPLLLQEASVGSLEDFGAMRKKRLEKVGKATPGVEKMKALGHWNDEWDALLFLDPAWTDRYMAMCAELYAENVLPPKELELLLIAFDSHNLHASVHFTRQHIKNAFRAGATVGEIMEVLKVGVVQGVRTCNLGVTILAEELEREAAGRHAAA
jgi:alkylhydroperoxidase/carboxymuconolactone decarboxylase family protein YurZ